MLSFCCRRILCPCFEAFAYWVAGCLSFLSYPLLQNNCQMHTWSTMPQLHPVISLARHSQPNEWNNSSPATDCRKRVLLFRRDVQNRHDSVQHWTETGVLSPFRSCSRVDAYPQSGVNSWWKTATITKWNNPRVWNVSLGSWVSTYQKGNRHVFVT